MQFPVFQFFLSAVGLAFSIDGSSPLSPTDLQAGCAVQDASSQGVEVPEVHCPSSKWIGFLILNLFKHLKSMEIGLTATKGAHFMK